MIDAVNFDEAYRRSREAMLDCLRSRIIDPDGLKAMQRGMANLKPHKQAFGPERYDELRRLLNQIEHLYSQRSHLVSVAQNYVPAAYSAQPVAPQPWQNKLSLDQMIGIFCLCFLFVASGFNLHLMAYVFGIWGIILAWRWLHRRAPTTANIIFIIFGSLVLALLSAGRRGRRRRW